EATSPPAVARSTSDSSAAASPARGAIRTRRQRSGVALAGMVSPVRAISMHGVRVGIAAYRSLPPLNRRNDEPARLASLAICSREEFRSGLSACVHPLPFAALPTRRPFQSPGNLPMMDMLHDPWFYAT